MLKKEDIQKIENHYIITKQRSGSTLLSFILAGSPNSHVIHEENIYYKYASKYQNKIFDKKNTIIEFLNDFFEFATHHPIEKYYLPDRNKLEESLFEYVEYQLNFREFCNLFYLFFYDILNNKNTEVIINKDITYHVSASKIYKRNSNTKFVFLIRDVVSNISSHVKRKIITKNAVAHSFLWRKMMSDILDDISLIPQSNYIIIKYEELIINPEVITKKICDFLQIKFDLQMINHKQIAQQKYDYIYKRTLELNGIGPFPIFDQIHTESRSSINIEKIKENIFSNNELEKIHFITYHLRKKFNYLESAENKNNKVKIPISDMLASIKLLLMYQIFKFYHRSNIYNKIIFRKINIFNFFNSRNNSKLKIN